jgi:CubicO group peptidase (beta-lactamase class C family)
MAPDALSEFVAATATRFGIPGVAVGVWADGREAYAVPAGLGHQDLYRDRAAVPGRRRPGAAGGAGAPLCPRASAQGREATAQVTVLHLLDHRGAGLGLIAGFGEGDDALAGYVARLAELELLGPPGGRASSSRTGYNLADRVIETVTSLTYEGAVASLVFAPLGLSHSFFARDDVMTRRLIVGHNRDQRCRWRAVAAFSRRQPPAGTSRPRWPTSCAGPGSSSATTTRRVVPRCCRPRYWIGCSSRRLCCGAATSATRAARWWASTSPAGCSPGSDGLALNAADLK